MLHLVGNISKEKSFKFLNKTADFISLLTLEEHINH